MTVQPDGVGSGGRGGSQSAGPSQSGKQVLIERLRQNMEEALRSLPVWLLHDENKIPIYASGKNRRGTLDSPEDRAQLVEFEDAALGLLKCPRAVGLGVALGAVPGTDIILSGMDFDDCYVNGALVEPAARVLTAATSYAEKSLSGKGLHINAVHRKGILCQVDSKRRNCVHGASPF
jgi:hypothetical protein